MRNIAGNKSYAHVICMKCVLARRDELIKLRSWSFKSKCNVLSLRVDRVHMHTRGHIFGLFYSVWGARLKSCTHKHTYIAWSRKHSRSMRCWSANQIWLLLLQVKYTVYPLLPLPASLTRSVDIQHCVFLCVRDTKKGKKIYSM